MRRREDLFRRRMSRARGTTTRNSCANSAPPPSLPRHPSLSLLFLIFFFFLIFIIIIINDYKFHYSASWLLLSFHSLCQTRHRPTGSARAHVSQPSPTPIYIIFFTSAGRNYWNVLHLFPLYPSVNLCATVNIGKRSNARTTYPWGKKKSAIHRMSFFYCPKVIDIHQTAPKSTLRTNPPLLSLSSSALSSFSYPFSLPPPGYRKKLRLGRADAKHCSDGRRGE